MSTRIGSMGPFSLVATTGTAGFALQNATPNILTWTAPNDGNMHRVLIFGEIRVIALETGGQVSLNFTYPDNSGTPSGTVFAAAGAAGFHGLQNTTFLVAPGQTVTLAQTTALTAGSAIIYVELWAS